MSGELPLKDKSAVALIYCSTIKPYNGFWYELRTVSITWLVVPDQEAV